MCVKLYFMKLVSSALVGFQEGRRIYNKSIYMKKKEKKTIYKNTDYRRRDPALALVIVNC